ncbi:hypothetical protein ABZY34_25420 [Streptomyces virginiae]|uniref:RICIN domain-containing protein n=1 Tax=Streptomyces virginiae TaxID=1961 RepID=UPI0033B98645
MCDMESNVHLEPERAEDIAAFVGLMRALKDRTGMTYRQLEQQAAHQGTVLPRSTLADVLAGKKLPRPQLVVDFVRVCGDGDRAEAWLQAWGRILALPPDEDGTTEMAPRPAARLGTPRRVRLLLRLTAVCLLGGLAATGWLLSPSTGAAKAALDGASTAPYHPAPLPTGWIRIRPATAPALCVTDGHVSDRRFTPMVAVQRPCGQTAPQKTSLQMMGAGTYRIRWDHPEEGPACLKAHTYGPGAGLLEPWAACEQSTAFRIEPSPARGAHHYLIHLDDHRCIGIKNADTRLGTEAEIQPCTGKENQIFLIEPV